MQLDIEFARWWWFYMYIAWLLEICMHLATSPWVQACLVWKRSFSRDREVQPQVSTANPPRMYVHT